MNFEKVESTENLKSRISNGHIEIGLYPVIYGFRVRVSIEGDEFCQLDLCGGNNLEMIDLLYNGCRQILEGQFRENGRADFKEFPTQNRKPFFKDMNFLKEFCDLILKYREHDIDDPRFKVTQDMLDQCRLDYNLNPI
jgi:hypothetical protein